MSEQKHTPGPWKIIAFVPDERYEIATEKSTSSFYRSVATVTFGYSEPAETEQHANARLIAAAPELLEACTTMAEWFRKEKAGFGKDRSTPEGESEWREWWEEQLRLCDQSEIQANAAIAKAIGG